MIRYSLAALGLAGALAFTAPLAKAEPLKELTFGVISTESTQNLKSIWDPFIADMQKKLGMPVKAYFASDYAGVIQAQRFGKVDIAWYGNKSAIEAVDRANGEVFVQTVSAQGLPGYWSVLVTHKDNPLAQFEPVKSSGADFDPEKYKTCEPCMAYLVQHSKDLTLGNGDPNSTSGFLVPSYYVFALNKMDAKKDFKRMITANHETNALAAANKQVDVATNNTENLERMKQNFPEKFAQLRTIWISPLIASDPIVWRNNLDAADKKKLKNFFLTYGTGGSDAENERKILAALQWAPFRESSNKQLVPFRQLELAREKTKIETDDKMSADEKARKLVEIEAKLASLDRQLATN
jgi:phosphonate transport system substrate-binding protein